MHEPSYHDVSFFKQYLSAYININFDEHIIILLLVQKCTLNSKQIVTLDVVCCVSIDNNFSMLQVCISNGVAKQ